MAACGGGEPAKAPVAAPKVTEKHAELELPSAKHPSTIDASDAPRVTVAHGAVTIEGKAVGSLPDKIERIDGLFEALKVRREAWKGAHPGKDFPGVVLLAIDRAASLAGVKSAFQTAAFSGYPNISFVVRGPDGHEGRVSVDAQVPGPPHDGPVERALLWVSADGDKRLVHIFDDKGALGMVTETSPAELDAKITSLWPKIGIHRAASDRKFDQAVVYASDISYSALVETIDALHGADRNFTVGSSTDRVPAINVTFSVGKPPESGDAPFVGEGVNGRVPPEIIQRVVRGRFAEMRKCYEAGLARDKHLTGKVSVKFEIGPKGKVTNAGAHESTTMPDQAVVQCVVKEFTALVFPEPSGGKVIVVYPINFTPEDD